jgi:hypothetical protein
MHGRTKQDPPTTHTTTTTTTTTTAAAAAITTITINTTTTTTTTTTTHHKHAATTAQYTCAQRQQGCRHRPHLPLQHERCGARLVEAVLVVEQEPVASIRHREAMVCLRSTSNKSHESENPPEHMRARLITEAKARVGLVNAGGQRGA